MSSSTGHTGAVMRPLIRELFPCLNSPTTYTVTAGSDNRCRAPVSRSTEILPLVSGGSLDREVEGLCCERDAGTRHLVSLPSVVLVDQLGLSRGGRGPPRPRGRDRRRRDHPGRCGPPRARGTRAPRGAARPGPAPARRCAGRHPVVDVELVLPAAVLVPALVLLVLGTRLLRGAPGRAVSPALVRAEPRGTVAALVDQTLSVPPWPPPKTSPPTSPPPPAPPPRWSMIRPSIGPPWPPAKTSPPWSCPRRLRRRRLLVGDPPVDVRAAVATAEDVTAQVTATAATGAALVMSRLSTPPPSWPPL